MNDLNSTLQTLRESARRVTDQIANVTRLHALNPKTDLCSEAYAEIADLQLRIALNRLREAELALLTLMR